MKNIVISFKSRNEIYSFARILKTKGIYCSIINTPKSIGSTCSLSIKTDIGNFETIKYILKRTNLQTFIGVYSTQTSVYGEQTLRLL